MAEKPKRRTRTRAEQKRIDATGRRRRQETRRLNAMVLAEEMRADAG